MSKESEQPRFRRGENANKPYGGKISDDPLSQALHKSALASGFESQSALAKALEIHRNTVRKWYRSENTPSPSVFGDLLVFLDLNDEKREPLVEAYANRLGEREASPRLKLSRGRGIKKMQRDLDYRTYNGSQLGQDFGVSRETIRLIRKKLKFPLLLTEEQRKLVINELDRTKDSREKQQQIRMKNRSRLS